MMRLPGIPSLLLLLLGAAISVSAQGQHTFFCLQLPFNRFNTFLVRKVSLRFAVSERLLSPLRRMSCSLHIVSGGLVWSASNSTSKTVTLPKNIFCVPPHSRLKREQQPADQRRDGDPGPRRLVVYLDVVVSLCLPICFEFFSLLLCSAILRIINDASDTSAPSITAAPRSAVGGRSAHLPQSSECDVGGKKKNRRRECSGDASYRIRPKGVRCLITHLSHTPLSHPYQTHLSHTHPTHHRALHIKHTHTHIFFSRVLQVRIVDVVRHLLHLQREYARLQIFRRTLL